MDARAPHSRLGRQDAAGGDADLDEIVSRLRARRATLSTTNIGARAVTALVRAAAIWDARLQSNWTPPPGSPFPWPMVRISLAALLPGLRAADDWLQSARSTIAAPKPPPLVALLLAGNTPLLTWPALAAGLLAGSAVFVKRSRGETLWPQLFVETLAQADAELADLIHLDAWPGDDPRTSELVRAADAVIAYGSDASIAALRAATQPETLFLGFGHALSVGVVLAALTPPASGGSLPSPNSGRGVPASMSSSASPTTPRVSFPPLPALGEGVARSAGGEGGPEARAGTLFARDVLLYDQGGCLSPQAIFVEGEAEQARDFGAALADALAQEADALEVVAVTDPGVALVVRQARDLALFTPGTRVWGDDSLRWTVLTYDAPRPLDPPTGHGVVSVVPIADAAQDFGSLLGAARGRISSVGVAGRLRPGVRAALLAEGVRRICAAGEMQTPPLDWPNGGRDLLADLFRCGR